MTEMTPSRWSPQRLWRDNRGLILFFFLMMVFRSAWADWMLVPTGSMNPTLLEGDRILVDKHVFGVRVPWTLTRLTDGRDPQRGEIVVFDSPADGVTLVKRVVGVPGDLIAMDEHGLFINGKAATYAPGDPELIDTLMPRARSRDPVVLREAGVLPEHDVLRMAHGSPRQFFGPVRVPDDMYFMLGDNRDDSADSRYIGFVPRRNIYGLTSRVVASLNPDNFYLPRRGRYFTPLE